MKVKKQKRKFLRNIIIGIIALIVVAFIINTAPGFKRNKYQNVTNLVIVDENVTENLNYPVYIDEEQGIYISKEDIQDFFDKTIYYDEENNSIITTAEVAVASMEIGKKEININSAITPTLYTIIYNNNIMYIPMQEMEAVYNIDVQYLEDENVVIVDKLNEGMIKAEVNENTDIRFKPRGLSKKVGKLEVGESVSAFYTTSKGWRLIRTSDGKIGYVKANVLTNEYILRQDMHQDIETKEISVDVGDNTSLNIDGNRVLVKDLLKMTDEGILLKNTDIQNVDENTKIWANLSIEDADLTKYKNRTNLINNIATIARRNNISGINVILNNSKNIERLVIELAPRLREIGIIINVVANENKLEINKEQYTDIVNYIILVQE